MYTLDQASNRISPVSVRSFAELGFTERMHLQDWLAHRSEVLGGCTI